MRRALIADILTVDEVELWTAMRAGLARNSGYRSTTVRDLAARRGINPDDLNRQTQNIKDRLIEAGIVDVWTHFAHPDRWGTWNVTSVPVWSKATNRHIAAGHPRFSSARYAHNAAVAANILAQIDSATSRDWLADQIDSLEPLDAGTDPQHQTGETPSGHDGLGRLITYAAADGRVGFHLPDLGGRRRVSWSGSVAHARWIAHTIRIGQIIGNADT